MSNPSHLTHDLGVAAGKLAVAAPVGLYGWFTLNNIVAVLGGVASLMIIAHTALKIWWDWQDRAGKRVGPPVLTRNPADE